MPLSYPDNTIWFVSSSDGIEVSEGSAVAIRLQKRDDSKTAMSYLLTCAHVIRAACERKGNIRAWPPDVGHNTKQAKDVEVDATFKELPFSESNAADDWVILRICDAQAASAAPTVRKWAGNALSGSFRIWGYMGGTESFPRGIVLPTRTPDTFFFRDASNGAVHFNGQGTRPGISGGGVFGEDDGQFAGIHRARSDSTLQVSAVSSYYIKRRLYELGYEVSAAIGPQQESGRIIAASPLPDRRERLFGRADDLEQLRERASHQGLTAVVARSQMGKSWLLTELARRLSVDERPPCLIGYAESFGESPDLLLRALVDLYRRWWGDSRYWQQAKMAWQQQREGLQPGFAKAFARIMPEVGVPGGVAIREGIEELVAADQTPKGGGFQLPALQYDHARDLVRFAAETSKRRIVLFLDQWDKSPSPAREAKTIDAFLRHLDDWPACHIFLASLPDDDALKPLSELAAGYPASARLFPLRELNLDERSEIDRLMNFLRAKVPATSGAAPEFLLGCIAGYAGVISRWTSLELRERMQSSDDLKAVAADAQNYRFRELEELLATLDSDQRKLALRIALLPQVEDDEAWNALRVCVTEGVSEDALDDLKLKKILEAVDPPSFGHARRSAATRAWFVKNRPRAIEAEVKPLIFALAKSITGPDLDAIYAVTSVHGLYWAVKLRRLGPLYLAVCRAASSILGANVPAQLLIDGSREARSQKCADASGLLSMGLLNALGDVMESGDLEQRDALLNELREMARTFSDNAVVSRRLAYGLRNTLLEAHAAGAAKRRDGLLQELRGLSGDHADPTIHEELAKALFDAMEYSKRENELDRRDAILDEMRALAKSHPTVGVSDRLGRALINAHDHAKSEQNLPRRDELLNELRNRAQVDEPAAYTVLANGLHNTLLQANSEGDIPRRDFLLDELRALYSKHPIAGVREWFAKGLYSALNYADAARDVARRDALLGELRHLQLRSDPIVRHELAKALVNLMVGAHEENDLERGEALLNELRGLAQESPDDILVREQLGKGLRNNAFQHGAPDSRMTLLDELRRLTHTHPHDAALRENLAFGLSNAQALSMNEGDTTSSDALLEELRKLAHNHPADAAVRTAYAISLDNMLNYAQSANDVARINTIRKELIALSAFPS